MSEVSCPLILNIVRPVSLCIARIEGFLVLAGDVEVGRVAGPSDFNDVAIFGRIENGNFSTIFAIGVVNVLQCSAVAD